jgi:hyperosmotically inducible protein
LLTISRYCHKKKCFTAKKLNLGEVMKSLALLFACLALVGCNSSNKPEATDPKKDNTAINERDKSGTAKTPIDQNENQADIDITAKIRSRVIETEKSINAKNVKIITQKGEVTLRGPVNDAGEKERIEKVAREVAGNSKVVSELEVRP